tara:strand:+ start:2705 stop:2887 length:183 start_codon:yes stop_codon:yes gene_type:complete
MTDKEWETLLERMNVELVDFVKKEENKIILQVIKNIIDKDKTRTLDELAQEHSNPPVDAL